MAQAGQSSETRGLLRQATATGWPLRRSRNGGWVLLPPLGAPITIHATPSDARHAHNTASAIRRAERAVRQAA